MVALENYNSAQKQTDTEISEKRNNRTKDVGKWYINIDFNGILYYSIIYRCYSFISLSKRININK